MNSKAYKNYEIDEYEYNELKWFCWQYDKKKRKISNTENDSEKQKLKKEIKIIDTALMLVSDSDLIISLVNTKSLEAFQWDEDNFMKKDESFLDFKTS